MTRRRTAVLLTCLAWCGALVAPAATAGAPGGDERGGVGIRLLDAPTDRADDPRALVYVVDHLHPGEVIERRLALTNTTGRPVAVDLYVAAADVAGDAWRPRAGRAASELTSWSSVTPGRLTIEPGAERIAALRVAVPEGATGGERYAVVWVEPPPGGGDVRVVNRAGVRMYLSVGDGAEPASAFRIESLRAVRDESGGLSIGVEVRNVGGRAVDVSGTVTLADGPAGRVAGPYRTGRTTTIAPGAVGTVAFGVSSDLDPGPWRADIGLRSGATGATASIRFRFPDGPGELRFPVDGSVDPETAAAPATTEPRPDTTAADDADTDADGAGADADGGGADADGAGVDARGVGGEAAAPADRRRTSGSDVGAAALLAAVLLVAVGAGAAVAARSRLRRAAA